VCVCVCGVENRHAKPPACNNWKTPCQTISQTTWKTCSDALVKCGTAQGDMQARPNQASMAGEGWRDLRARIWVPR